MNKTEIKDDSLDIPTRQTSKFDAIIAAFKFFMPRTIFELVILFITLTFCGQIVRNNTDPVQAILYFKEKIVDSKNDTPELDETKFKEISESLIKIGANSVSIYSADLGSASRKLVYARIGNSELTDFVGDTDSLYLRITGSESDKEIREKAIQNEHVVKAQNGEFICTNELLPTSRYGSYLQKTGIVSGCAIGIPSGFSKYFVGIITVGFNRKIESKEIDLLRNDLFRNSQVIVKNTGG